MSLPIRPNPTSLPPLPVSLPPASETGSIQEAPWYGHNFQENLRQEIIRWSKYEPRGWNKKASAKIRENNLNILSRKLLHAKTIEAIVKSTKFTELQKEFYSLYAENLAFNLLEVLALARVPGNEIWADEILLSDHVKSGLDFLHEFLPGTFKTAEWGLARAMPFPEHIEMLIEPLNKSGEFPHLKIDPATRKTSSDDTFKTLMVLGEWALQRLHLDSQLQTREFFLSVCNEWCRSQNILPISWLLALDKFNKQELLPHTELYIRLNGESHFAQDVLHHVINSENDSRWEMWALKGIDHFTTLGNESALLKDRTFHLFIGSIFLAGNPLPSNIYKTIKSLFSSKDRFFKKLLLRSLAELDDAKRKQVLSVHQNFLFPGEPMTVEISAIAPDAINNKSSLPNIHAILAELKSPEERLHFLQGHGLIPGMTHELPKQEFGAMMLLQKTVRRMAPQASAIFNPVSSDAPLRPFETPRITKLAYRFLEITRKELTIQTESFHQTYNQKRNPIDFHNSKPIPSSVDIALPNDVDGTYLLSSLTRDFFARTPLSPTRLAQIGHPDADPFLIESLIFGGSYRKREIKVTTGHLAHDGFADANTPQFILNGRLSQISFDALGKQTVTFSAEINPSTDQGAFLFWPRDRDGLLLNSLLPPEEKIPWEEKIWPLLPQPSWMIRPYHVINAIRQVMRENFELDPNFKDDAFTDTFLTSDTKSTHTLEYWRHIHDPVSVREGFLARGGSNEMHFIYGELLKHFNIPVAYATRQTADSHHESKGERIALIVWPMNPLDRLKTMDHKYQSKLRYIPPDDSGPKSLLSGSELLAMKGRAALKGPLAHILGMCALGFLLHSAYRYLDENFDMPESLADLIEQLDDYQDRKRNNILTKMGIDRKKSKDAAHRKRLGQNGTLGGGLLGEYSPIAPHAQAIQMTEDGGVAENALFHLEAKDGAPLPPFVYTSLHEDFANRDIHNPEAHRSIHDLTSSFVHNFSEYPENSTGIVTLSATERFSDSGILELNSFPHLLDISDYDYRSEPLMTTELGVPFDANMEVSGLKPGNIYEQFLAISPQLADTTSERDETINLVKSFMIPDVNRIRVALEFPELAHQNWSARNTEDIRPMVQYVLDKISKDYIYVMDPGKDPLHVEFVENWDIERPGMYEEYWDHIHDPARRIHGKHPVQCNEITFVVTQVLRQMDIPVVDATGYTVNPETGNTQMAHHHPLVLWPNATGEFRLHYLPFGTKEVLYNSDLIKKNPKPVDPRQDHPYLPFYFLGAVALSEGFHKLKELWKSFSDARKNRMQWKSLRSTPNNRKPVLPAKTRHLDLSHFAVPSRLNVKTVAEAVNILREYANTVDTGLINDNPHAGDNINTLDYWLHAIFRTTGDLTLNITQYHVQWPADFYRRRAQERAQQSATAILALAESKSELRQETRDLLYFIVQQIETRTEVLWNIKINLT